MNAIDTPQGRCKVGLASCDITPPVGTYHRMWGASLHEVSTGVHRPLRATLLWAESLTDPGQRLAIVSVDHCILDEAEIASITAKVCAAVPLRPEQFHVTLSHTHAAGWMSRSRSHLPGGEGIGPYLDRMAEAIVGLARQASAGAEPATLVYGTGRCSLAVQRDFYDATSGQYVCGLNPAGTADDTLVVARIDGEGGQCMGTVVNYACHPTTLAWQNRLISPDWVGAMRELVESATGSPCLFLQGASGDLGPREGYVGDPAVADRNGRQVGHAALATLEAIPPAGTRFVYQGPVISGAVLGTWAHQPVDARSLSDQAQWYSDRFTVDLLYRLDLPTRPETTRLRDQYLAEEQAARQAGDEVGVRDAHARVEQMNRQLNRLAALPEGRAFPFPVTVWRLGGATWVMVPGELYQSFQTTLRQRLPGSPIMVATLTGGWQPAYLPSASAYGLGIYQEVIAALAPGSLEALTEALVRRIRVLG